MTTPFRPHEMPPGPAHLWGTFLGALERLEDATGQFVHVSLPDLLDGKAPDRIDMDMVYDRLTNVVEQLRTAANVLWMRQAGL